jgi:hypothetical protein
MFKKLKDYVDALFAKHSRLIVIRLDLSYHVSNDLQPKQLVTLQQAKNDLAHLLKNTRHNALFEHVVGYIWKLEYGQSRGYHYHIILFFLGSKVQKDVYIAMQIGKYWSEVITNKRGHYYNCNNDKAKHDSFGNLGIGRINADDTRLRFNLLNKVVKYFIKKEQYLRNRLDPPLPLLSDLPVAAWDVARKSLNCIEHSKAAIVHGVKILKKGKGGLNGYIPSA